MFRNTRRLLVMIGVFVLMCGVATVPASAAAYPNKFNPSHAAEWAAQNYTHVYPSSWRDESKGNHCAEFVSAALHNGGMPFTGNWRPNSELRPWEKRDKKAYYNARSLRNWLTSNGWVDEISLNPRNWQSYYGLNSQPGDIIFYDWTGRGNYSDVHISMVIEAAEQGLNVVDQGAGTDPTYRPWDLGGLADTKGKRLVDLHPDMQVKLLRWKR